MRSFTDQTGLLGICVPHTTNGERGVVFFQSTKNRGKANKAWGSHTCNELAAAQWRE